MSRRTARKLAADATNMGERTVAEVCDLGIPRELSLFRRPHRGRLQFFRMPSGP